MGTFSSVIEFTGRTGNLVGAKGQDGKVIIRNMREEVHSHLVSDIPAFRLGDQQDRHPMTFFAIEKAFSLEILLIDVDCCHKELRIS